MADQDKSSHPPPAATHEGAGAYDREIDMRSILWFGAALVGATAVALLMMWWMSASFKAIDQAKDGPPSPIIEAHLDPIPPGPRLQPVPPRDMDELRAEDHKMLTTYGWVDQAHGVARIPVDRAIAILAEKGLPATPPQQEAAADEAVQPAAAPTAAPHEAAPAPKPKAHKKKEPK